MIDRGSWPMPPVFPWLQRLGEVEQAEMDQVFNMGLGWCWSCSPLLCRQHPASAHPRRRRELADRPGAAGPGGVVWKE